MIVVNENGKTLVKVATWSEMYQRIGFQQYADPKSIQLKEIIGWYSFDIKGPCGLTSCRTEHLRGFIVDLGGSKETNIGNVCGKKHFGVIFKQLKEAFRLERNAQQFREDIAARQSEALALLARLQHLREGEYQADDCYRKMNKQMSQLFDEQTSRALRRKAQRNDNRIIRSVALTADEKDLGLGFGRDEEFREELVGVVNGIQATNTYARLSPRRLDTFQAEIEAFAALDAENLTHKQLQEHGRWLSRLDKTFEDLDETLADCQRFLVPENLATIRAQKYNLHRS
jgi:hypothetical protein